MTARAYQITLTSRTARAVRHVIAHSTVQAIRIGIAMMPVLSNAEGHAFGFPCGITCKPARLK